MMIDSREFRNALGRFATGIAIVTTHNSSSEPIGITINSFSSVSLEPPLVLFSIGKTSSSLEAFQNNSYFGISILNSHQQAISHRFASNEINPFSNLPFVPKTTSALILEDALAFFDCQTKFQYEGGDHIIFVGEVVDFSYREGEPLLYYSSQYRSLSIL